ncbi:type II toxin-antitoxin system RelE/ParE family toxin [Janibacter alittae]|uniref:Type II toxin-antitoxin system RelE/ParE family toxin n=1 Tax=Janibacter alittae TaxID=3115209 RepID=A0ABZ2MI49_9MICO
MPLVRSELLDIPDENARGWLLGAMKEYEKGRLPANKVKPIGDGIFEITVNRDGVFLRCLFFHPKPYIAVGLKVYMKKSNKLPKQIHKVAKDRMRAWKDDT